MTKKIEYGDWLALQPIKGKNDSGYDRGSIFTMCTPWMSVSWLKKDWSNKPYLTVTDINTMKRDLERGYSQPTIYPYGSPIYKLFQKIKNERNWFLKLCNHDLDWQLKKLEAICSKCNLVFLIDNPGENQGYTVNTKFIEALAFRSQFGGLHA